MAVKTADPGDASRGVEPAYGSPDRVEDSPLYDISALAAEQGATPDEQAAAAHAALHSGALAESGPELHGNPARAYLRPFNPAASDPAMRCQSVWATGEQCDRSVVMLAGNKPATYCRWHFIGASEGAPTRASHSPDAFARATAVARMEMLRILPDAVDTVEYLITDENVPAAVRMRASFGILDRVGLGPTSHLSVDARVEVSDKPSEEIATRLSQIESRLSGNSGSSGSSEEDVVDADIVE